MTCHWDEIIEHYEDGQKRWTNDSHMLNLVRWLKESGYVEAGLFGAISIYNRYDLCLSRSSHILCGDPRYQTADPRLRISATEAWFHGPIVCRLRYEDGSDRAWELLLDWDELVSQVGNALVKRLRWFKICEVE